MELHFCPLFSGSSGNAVYIAAGETRILIDAGKSGRALEEALLSINVRAADLSGIIITHEHADHISGAGVLARRHDLPIYANEKTWAAMARDIGKLTPPQRRVIENSDAFFIGELTLRAHSQPHDAADPVGYTVTVGKKSVAVATDLGHTTPEIISRIAESDLVLLESNHDEDMVRKGPYPPYLQKRILGRKGHLSNGSCGEALIACVKGGVRHALLGHLSAENNTPAVAMATVAAKLKAEGIVMGSDVAVDMTRRDGASGYYIL